MTGLKTGVKMLFEINLAWFEIKSQYTPPIKETWSQCYKSTYIIIIVMTQWLIGIQYSIESY